MNTGRSGAVQKSKLKTRVLFCWIDGYALVYEAALVREPNFNQVHKREVSTVMNQNLFSRKVIRALLGYL